MRSRVYVTVWVCVHLSVCPIIRPQQRRAAGLLLSAPRSGDIDRAPSSKSAAARGSSAALSSKRGQCHVDSRVGEAEHRLVVTASERKCIAEDANVRPVHENFNLSFLSVFQCFGAVGWAAGRASGL